jgi:hypothetical protein
MRLSRPLARLPGAESIGELMFARQDQQSACSQSLPGQHGWFGPDSAASFRRSAKAAGRSVFD